jgi:biopolymer transport protein ExbD
MAFRRIEASKDLELPTLIDIIFLLLIFFLLTYSPVPPKVGQSVVELNLPEAEGATLVNQNEELETMMIEILPLNKDDLSSGFQVSVLLPFEDFGIDRDVKVNYNQAKLFAKTYQREAILPIDYASLNQKEFLDLPAVKLINEQLERYVERKFRVPRITNRIEIRANKEVTFKIINFIITKCASYEDLIPSLIFRTMYIKE